MLPGLSWPILPGVRRPLLACATFWDLTWHFWDQNNIIGHTFFHNLSPKSLKDDPNFQGRVISEKKRPLPGSLHTVVRIWVRNHQNTSQDSRDVLFLKKKGPCQEACTPSSGFGSEITKTHPKISRDVLFQKKKGPCQEACTQSSEFGWKIDFSKSRLSN